MTLGELVVAVVVVVVLVWVPLAILLAVIFHRAGGSKMVAEMRGAPLRQRATSSTPRSVPGHHR